MAKKPTAYFQSKKFPRDVLDRIDAAAKLLGITREDVVIETMTDATIDVKEFQDKLRDERIRRLNRIKDEQTE